MLYTQFELLTLHRIKTGKQDTTNFQDSSWFIKSSSNVLPKTSESKFKKYVENLAKSAVQNKVLIMKSSDHSQKSCIKISQPIFKRKHLSTLVTQ